MGVIRKLRNSAAVISFSEESINSLGISQPATPPSEPESVDAETVLAPVRRDPNLLLQRLEHCRVSRHTGSRRNRRANNTRALQTLVEDESESYGEPTITDLQPNTENAFTRLHKNDNNMRIWQYFITLEEQEQREYLEEVQPSTQRGSRPSLGVSFTQAKTYQMQEAELPETEEGFTVVPRMSDCRHLHPALSEQQRFAFIDNNLLAVLKKKHVPLGILSQLEEEIVVVFTGDPSAVYITQALNSYQRLLLHALCQYNFLASKSTTIAGVRRTKVKNMNKCFHAPHMALSDYLETYYR